MFFWREQKWTKSDNGWLTGIDKIYRRNSVGLISAKYPSNAKWCARHGGNICFFSNSFAEKVIKCRRLPTTVCWDGVFLPKKHGPPFVWINLKCEMPQLELTSSRPLLAIKRCQWTKIGDVINLSRSSLKRRVHICAHRGKAVKSVQLLIY